MSASWLDVLGSILGADNDGAYHTDSTVDLPAKPGVMGWFLSWYKIINLLCI